MITGYLDAYRVFKDDHFLEMALGNATFLVKNAKSHDGRLTRNNKDGRSTINAFLDDYQKARKENDIQMAVVMAIDKC